MQYEYLARVGTRYLGGIISAESRKQAVRLIRMAWPGAQIVTIGRGKRTLTPDAWHKTNQTNDYEEE